MKLTIDLAAHTTYLKLQDGDIEESEEVAEGIVLDFDVDGIVIGIECLRLSPDDERLMSIEIKTKVA